MKLVTLAPLLAAASLAWAGPAAAEEYKDYDYAPGVSMVTLVAVDPNHIDDYLLGLQKTQVPVMEILKKHGLIDGYSVSVKDGGALHGPNVAIVAHYVSYAAMSPNRERDMEINREIEAATPAAAEKPQVAKYEGYRELLDIGSWRVVTPKQ